MSGPKLPKLLDWDERPIGLHSSISEGIEQALVYAHELSCRSAQFYTKNERRWLAAPLSNDEVEAFQAARRRTNMQHCFAHVGQLPNLAAGKRSVIQNTMESMRLEMLRADTLEIESLIIMPGSHQGDGELHGIRRVADRINILLDETCFTPTKLILKCTDGSNDGVGYSFEHLRDILANVRDATRIGVCLNTAHLFAAGYDFSTPSNYAKLWEDFHRTVGIDWLHLIQVSDTTRACGSYAHRHTHIGKGKIGMRAFGMLMRDPRLAGIPMICDTPSGKTDTADRNNLAALEKLAKR